MSGVKRYGMDDFGGRMVERSDGAFYHEDDFYAVSTQFNEFKQTHVPTIEVEKLLCKALKTQWSADRISIAGLIDALAQQLAASQAEVAKLEDELDNFANWDVGQHKVIQGLSADLAARDKRLAEAEGLLRELESVDASEPYCPICFKLKDYGHDEDCKLRAFLSQAEDKANG